jgi:uncharacterized protein (TIGR03437 family)
MRKLTSLPLLLGGLAALATAQSTFNGFTSGNLVLTRSVYTGDASTVALGQPLPPICPATAVCKGMNANSNGAAPNTTNSSNVWNNDKADGSFGITSPILIDQLNPATGSTISTLAVPTNLLVTSFSSKSEMAINLSADGTVLTMMGYVAPVNTVDVSNGNTPGVYDPTNPAGGSYFRGVLQIGANGALQVTPTNAYSGNNGRAAILANGLYYMVGNSNNGTGTPANVVASTGVQAATPGQPATTAPTAVGNFSITQLTNPATNAPYAADKAGKDNNYRGLTVFNNTLYVTKGSGSNGVDTVYQVGTSGSLPTLANAGSAPVNILPGFPQAIARTAGIDNIYPFGIWFADPNTLYVADEGDGVAADAANSKYAGLQKWSLVSGTWQLDYVLQSGLALGMPYAIANYPPALYPSTGGLRNITGRVNSDGTVTIWGVTSTVSANGDQGADPNRLVMVVDNLANTTAAGAASETFALLRTAYANEVLRGVALAPSSTTMPNVPSVVSAASQSATAIAPAGLAFVYGQNLAVNAGEIFQPLPTSVAGTSVSITDSTGAAFAAPLVFVSPSQVTFQVPTNVATGAAKVTVTSPNGTQTASQVQIAKVAPALFTTNGSGLAAGYAVTVSPSSAQTVQAIYSPSASGASWVANPISVSGGPTYLTLFGTGFQAAGTSGVTVTVNGQPATVVYAGPQGTLAGIDQVNVLLPQSLAGKGNVNILLTASGVQANGAQITVQ